MYVHLGETCSVNIADNQGIDFKLCRGHIRDRRSPEQTDENEKPK
jgi:hypothetical protein